MLALGAERVRLNTADAVPLLPSVTVAAAIEIDGTASSFVIVPKPVPQAIVAPEAAERMTRKVSSVSTVVSPLTSTVTDFAVSPGLKGSVPGAGGKSTGAGA